MFIPVDVPSDRNSSTLPRAIFQHDMLFDPLNEPEFIKSALQDTANSRAGIQGSRHGSYSLAAGVGGFVAASLLGWLGYLAIRRLCRFLTTGCVMEPKPSGQSLRRQAAKAKRDRERHVAQQQNQIVRISMGLAAAPKPAKTQPEQLDDGGDEPTYINIADQSAEKVDSPPPLAIKSDDDDDLDDEKTYYALVNSDDDDDYRPSQIYTPSDEAMVKQPKPVYERLRPAESNDQRPMYIALEDCESATANKPTSSPPTTIEPKKQ